MKPVAISGPARGSETEIALPAYVIAITDPRCRLVPPARIRRRWVRANAAIEAASATTASGNQAQSRWPRVANELTRLDRSAMSAPIRPTASATVHVVRAAADVVRLRRLLDGATTVPPRGTRRPRLVAAGETRLRTCRRCCAGATPRSSD